MESGAGAIITDDDIATAPVVTDASLQNAFQQSQTVAPAVSATYARLGGRRFRQMRAFGQRSGGGGQFAGGGNSAQFAGPGSGAQFGAPGSNVAPPGTAGSLASGAGAPIDCMSMMSYSPEPGTGEAWDPPGSLQPAANSGFPAGSGGTGGQGPGGVATSNPYSPVSNFPGTPWGQPSTSGPGRCCNPGGWAGLSLVGQAFNRWRRGNRGVQSGGRPINDSMYPTEEKYQSMSADWIPVGSLGVISSVVAWLVAWRVS